MAEDEEDLQNQPARIRWNDDLSEYDQRQVVRLARNLFIKNYPFERVFLLTGIPHWLWRKKLRKWTKLKEEVDLKIIERIRKKAISEQTTEFVEKGLHLGLMFLDRAIKREIELTPKDFKLCMDSVMAIHRVGQLEKGEPTDITAYEHMNPDELRRYLLDVAITIGKKHDDILSPIDTKELDYPAEQRLNYYLPQDNQKDVEPN